MFVSGKGIATARALLEATNDSYGLSIPVRKQVKVYYKVRSSWARLHTPWRWGSGGLGLGRHRCQAAAGLYSKIMVVLKYTGCACAR